MSDERIDEEREEIRLQWLTGELSYSQVLRRLEATGVSNATATHWLGHWILAAATSPEEEREQAIQRGPYSEADVKWLLARVRELKIEVAKALRIPDEVAEENIRLHEEVKRLSRREPTFEEKLAATKPVDLGDLAADPPLSDEEAEAFAKGLEWPADERDQALREILEMATQPQHNFEVCRDIARRAREALGRG